MFFQDASPTHEVIMARLCLLLHQTPEQIRRMTMEEVDAILYFEKCQNHKQQENSKVSSEMQQFKA